MAIRESEGRQFMTDNHRRFLRKHHAPRRWSVAKSLLAGAAGTVIVAGVTITPASATTTFHSNSRHPAASVPGSLSGTLTIGEREYFQPTMTQLVAAYEKYRPGVTVQVQELPNDNTYQTKLLTEKLAGSLPDIIATYDVLSPTLTTQGIEANLSPYLNSADLYPQSYWLPNFLASYIMDSGPDTGQVHALPMEADATVIYYNQNEFTAAGVPAPHGELDLEPDAGRRQEAREDEGRQAGAVGPRRRARLAGGLQPDDQGLRRDGLRAEVGGP